MTQVETQQISTKREPVHFQATPLASYDLTDDGQLLLTIGTTTYVEGSQVRTTEHAKHVEPGRIGTVVDLNYHYRDDQFLVRFPGNMHVAFFPEEIEMVSGPDHSITTANYQLTVSNLENETYQQIINTLQTLSGRHLSIGIVCIYAYFDEEEHAQKAATAVESVASCQTEIRVGQFNITSLVIK